MVALLRPCSGLAVLTRGLLLLLACSACQGITEPTEVNALLDVRAGFLNASQLSSWDASSDPCDTWQHIQCTPASQGGNRHVTAIQLPAQNLSGTLSSSIGLLTSLTLLDLNANNLSGDMPLEVGQLGALQRLVIHGSSFTGPLDPWLPKLTNLRIADFSLNHFSGPLPYDVGTSLRNLQNLDCSKCSLSGSLPASIGNLSSLQMLSLGANNLSGAIPPGIGALGGLQVLNLQNNSLSGPLPSELASLGNLNNLNLAFNNLTGSVPQSIIQDTASLTRFDGNPLCSLPENAPVCSGPPLPPLGLMPPGPQGPPGGPGGLGDPGNTSPTAANPLQANATAPALAPSPGLPTGGQPGVANQSAFLPSSTQSLSPQSGGIAPGPQNSPAAVGLGITTGQSAGPSVNQKGGSSFPVAAVFGIIGGGAAVAASAFIALAIARRKRAKADARSDGKVEEVLLDGSEPGSITTSGALTVRSHVSIEIPSASTSSEVDAPLLFTFRELQTMTDGFNASRQIGEGGFGRVYWARVRNQDVAVKRLEKDAAAPAKHAEKQFRTEVDVLSRLRHPHLLTLIGYCADGGERALVYPLMQNHSLHDQLHRIDKPCPELSSWHRRLTIAAQTACALAYLHNEASPPVIHRDFTSSNVLLDGSWVAVVSDFGLAKLMSKPGAPMFAQSTRLHGTLGYLAPEYLRGHITEKNDVYSFGVVLLELLSGRQAVVSEEFDLVVWASTMIDGPNFSPRMLLDPTVQEEPPAGLIDVAVRAARACVETDPKRRPQMHDVHSSLVEAVKCAYGEEDGRSTQSDRPPNSTVFETPSHQLDHPPKSI